MKYRLKNAIVRFLLKIVVYLSQDSNYIKHCKSEISEWLDDEGPNKWIADGTIQLLSVLSHQGHSGGSIGFAVELFKTMAMFKPWGPITGDESEWGEPFCDDGTRQNKRCGSIFLRRDGTAYNIDGKVFHDGDHAYYTNCNSFVDIEFPYVLSEPVIVDTTK